MPTNLLVYPPLSIESIFQWKEVQNSPSEVALRICKSKYIHIC